MHKLGYIASACACLFSLQAVYAQTSGPTAADVLRNIDQSKQLTNPTAPKPAAKKP